MRLTTLADGSRVSNDGLVVFKPDGQTGGQLVIYHQPANLGKTDYVVDIRQTGDYGTIAILHAALFALCEMDTNAD